MGSTDKRNGNGNPGHQRHHLSTFSAHLVAALGEFVGTFFFLYFGYAGNLMVTPQAPYPEVTLGLCIAGQLPWLRAVFLVPAQLLGSMCAGGLVDVMFPGSVAQANTVLGPHTSIVQGVFLEMFFTAQLIYVVLMLAAEKSKDTFMAPIGIGLALFVALIPGVPVTGGSANPARSFGCAVAGTDFPGYHWIYWVGPCLGAALAAGYFRLVKRLHYEEANPGQDAAYDA
ncbi:unnamed protein product [Fusarium equiseti]|uniref:Aquaporin n=1 Tax=Fusarium equiseti TaxID=61235 RepID=A0A8J2NCT3_FUSEQ|nr:unnamed protein product [Fusarium equiseti]